MIGAHAAGAYPGIQVSVLPYWQHEETAWRIDIGPSGDIRLLRSSVPVKVASRQDASGIQWKLVRETRISVREYDSLVGRLLSLQVASLNADYSANFSFPAPDTAVRTVHDDRSITYEPGEGSVVVTHGFNYQLQVSQSDLEVDALLYAPESALEQGLPQHPDREQIELFAHALREVVAVTGPVGELSAEAIDSWGSE